MKRLLALVLCLAMLIPMMVACGGNGTTPEDTSGNKPSGGANNKEPEKVAEPLLLENLSEYTIIYPDIGMNAELNTEIRALRDAIKDKFDESLDLKSDFISQKNPIKAREILISKTNRPESAEVYAKVPRLNDYAIQIVDEKLVVAASTDEMLVLVLHSLINRINDLPEDTTAFFTPEMQMLSTDAYDIEAVTVDGNDLGGYTIVCTNNTSALGMAYELQARLIDAYDYKLWVRTEQDVETLDKAIVFGETKFGLPEGVTGIANDQYYLGIANGNLYVYATDAAVLYQAIEKVVSQTADPKTYQVSINMIDVIEKPVLTALTSMSFNLWVSNVTDERVSHVVERIKRVKPDTLGVQEASSTWVNKLKAALEPEYGYIGVGRDANGTGEHSGIFYKKSTIKLIEGGTKWMSDTPDVVSKYPESACNRVFTYAVFERLSDGKRFLHVNAHTDHTGANGGVRLKQLKVLVKFVLANYSNLPVLITGDLNATESTAEIQHVLTSGWDNAAKIAFKTSNAATFPPNGSIIDFCLTSNDDFMVFEYAVDTYKYSGNKDYQKEGKDPSDHCPIYIRFELR